MTETIMFGILNFGHWNLFGIWCLEFGAYESYCLQFRGTPAKEAFLSNSLS